jgi:hypothetical protein
VLVTLSYFPVFQLGVLRYLFHLYAVALAMSRFPSEAMLAMRVAEADSTEDFAETNTGKRKEPK